MSQIQMILVSTNQLAASRSGGPATQDRHTLIADTHTGGGADRFQGSHQSQYTHSNGLKQEVMTVIIKSSCNSLHVKCSNWIKAVSEETKKQHTVIIQVTEVLAQSTFSFLFKRRAVSTTHTFNDLSSPFHIRFYLVLNCGGGESGGELPVQPNIINYSRRKIVEKFRNSLLYHCGLSLPLVSWTR